ncbi:ABC transporter ATP-binding protein [Microbacterium sp.]|uniref:ABC transporter ATP-binding protein n=1 Tax=Microbacterium sp. TaxID=51671 RepID=UPI00261E0416|nr:ABC transporter ATP-binding protein [uncultured Microbacterium sp.]
MTARNLGSIGAVPTPGTGSIPTAHLLVEGVTASYGGREVLHGVNLAVQQGGTTAIVGASGSGKTTLLRVIAGFTRPDSGQVRLGDTQVAGPGAPWVPVHRRGIGYVTQDGGLFPHLTVARNIAFGLDHLSRTARRDRVHDLLDLVSLPQDFATRRPDQLSGGQQQRVAIARALAREPELMLLDEPFSALDTGLRAATRRAVSEILALAGTTAILVTHDQSEALSFADQVAVMRDGELVQTGHPFVVYTRPVDRGVAEFLGEAIVLDAWLDGSLASCALGFVPVRNPPVQGRVQLMLRPEQVQIVANSPVRGTVEDGIYFGAESSVRIHLEPRADADPRLPPDAPSITIRHWNTALTRPGRHVALRVVGEGVVLQ